MNSAMEDAMRVSIRGISGATVLLAALAAGPAMAQQHGDHHRGERGGMGDMHGEMMEHCPMGGQGMMMMRGMMEEMDEGMMGRMMPMMMEGMMGAAMHPEALLERADELELTDEQVAELEALAERQAEMRRRMMEGREALQELLTDEQLEMLRERQRSRMGEMHRHMHGGDGEPPRDHHDR